MDTLIGYIVSPVLSPPQLKRLSQHKYSAQDVSFLDELCMKKFWDWFVSLYPLWLAPNLITLAGLLCNVFAALVLAGYCPDGIQTAPRWCYLLCAVSLFIYQTLDATDGKQARRTSSSSPLGELFDHGCDSISQVFVSLEICLSIQLGTYPPLVILLVIFSLFLFYAAHWQTYVCGTLRFTRFDVTEAQMVVIAICMISFVFGPGLWSLQIASFELKVLVIAFGAIGALLQFGNYAKVIFTGGVGKAGSTVADTSVVYPVVPILMACLPMLLIYFKSETEYFDDHIVLYCVMAGVVVSKITNRLIVAHMSKSELVTWDSIFLGPATLFMNQYFNTFVNEYLLLWICCIYCSVNLLIFCVVTTRQMCDYLNIECFRIPTPDR